MKKIVKIIIADDHPIVRNGYKSILEERSDYKVIGEANNGKELLDILKTKKPDVILLDIEMPVMDGFKAHEQLRKKYPSIKVIIISMHFEDAFVSHFFLNGASGYLSKDCEPEELLEAIDTVMKENCYLNTSTSKILLSGKINLTDIQEKILKMICEEKTNQEIGDKLDISAHTVDYHRRSILTKTKQSSVIGLVKYAIKHGITKLDKG